MRRDTLCACFYDKDIIFREDRTQNLFLTIKIGSVDCTYFRSALQEFMRFAATSEFTVTSSQAREFYYANECICFSVGEWLDYFVLYFYAKNLILNDKQKQILKEFIKDLDLDWEFEVLR